MGVGPLLIYGLSATGPMVVADLGLSRTQFGTFAATAFVAAGLSSAVVGRLVDERSERTTLTVLFAGAGAALLLGAFARTYVGVLLAVMVSGAAQALSNPVTNRLVSTYATSRARGLLMGIKQSGVQMAQVAAALVLPSLAVVIGWRAALGTASALAVAGLAIACWSVPRRGSTVASAQDGRDGQPLPAAVWWMTAHALISGAALQAVNVYLPLFGYERLHLTVTTAALTAAVVGGVGLAARIFWGRTADRVRSVTVPLLVLALVAGVGAACFLLADILASVVLLWLGAALFGASGIAANVVLMVAVVRAVPLTSVGRASGVLAIGLYFGFALGPIFFGVLVDATHSYEIGWALVGVSYLVTACLAPLAGRAGRPAVRSAPVVA